MEQVVYVAVVAGILALVFAFYLASNVSRQEDGNDKMKEIAKAISEGASAFLFSEYRILVIFVAVLFVVIGFGNGDWVTAVCFLVGAGFSVLAGYFGMNEPAYKGECAYSQCCQDRRHEQGSDSGFPRRSSYGNVRSWSGTVRMQLDLRNYGKCGCTVRIQPGCVIHCIICACRRRYLY